MTLMIYSMVLLMKMMLRLIRISRIFWNVFQRKMKRKRTLRMIQTSGDFLVLEMFPLHLISLLSLTQIWQWRNLKKDYFKPVAINSSPITTRKNNSNLTILWKKTKRTTFQISLIVLVTFKNIFRHRSLGLIITRKGS